jgi:hypothetical protein
MPPPTPEARYSSVIRERRSAVHSRKPEIVHAMLKRMDPGLPRMSCSPGCDAPAGAPGATKRAAGLILIAAAGRPHEAAEDHQTAKKEASVSEN